MANYTKHYNLKKPAQGDFYDIGDHNGNADIIDEELHKHEEKISGLTSPEFDDYESEDPETPVEVPDARTAIAGIKKGLKLSVILSKAKAAFMGLVTLGEIQQLLVNNGLCAEPGKFFMDAAFGKTLQDQVTQLYGNFTSSFIGKRNILNDTIITAAGGELFFLEPGIYQVTSEETSIYFPERYGTLCIFKTVHHYGCVIFISAIEGNMYHRHFNTNTVTWHTEWNKCAKF